MSWAEFRIRLFSYNRMELKEWDKVRWLAYQNLISTQYVMNDKAKIPKTIDDFADLYGINKKKKQKGLERLREEQRKFIEAREKNG